MSHLQEDIRSILETAVWAPSGDNSQPWRFRITQNRISIFNRPDRDIPFFNYGQRGSFVAHGGLIENIRIASSALGYATTITLFPEGEPREKSYHVIGVINEREDSRLRLSEELLPETPLDFSRGEKSDLVAIVELTPLHAVGQSIAPTTSKDEGLYSCVPQRATNRKPYLARPLTEAQRHEMARTPQEIGGGEVRFIEDEERKSALGTALSANERVVLETPALHTIFFHHVVWTEAEEKRKRTGLYVKTLELSPPQQFIFRLYRFGLLARIFNGAGLSRFIARDNAKLYASASALVAIIVPGFSASDFILAGRLTQRVWLKAVRMGLAAHPVTGVLFLMQRVRAKTTEGLSPYHSELLKEAYEKIQSLFQVERENIAMILRIGYGGEPGARSSRLPPEIEIIG